MSNGFAVKAALWERFKQGAQTHRRNPSRLLSKYMRQCLEVWEDQSLDENIRSDATRSGHKETDAVAIVRQYRRKR
jgi:hypothetical protein